MFQWLGNCLQQQENALRGLLSLLLARTPAQPVCICAPAHDNVVASTAHKCILTPGEPLYQKTVQGSSGSQQQARKRGISGRAWLAVMVGTDTICTYTDSISDDEHTDGYRSMNTNKCRSPVTCSDQQCARSTLKPHIVVPICTQQ